jgi:hypothetical protein
VTGYRLQALLDLRAGAERAARGRLAEALADEARAAGARDEAAGALGQATARLLARGRAALAGVAPAADLASRSRLLERLLLAEARLAGVLREREAERARSAERASAQKIALAEARAALRALERHRASWASDRRRARERREDASLDEVGASRAAASLSGGRERPSPGLPGTRS